MELRHLRYFINIIDGGSMALAGRRLHVSQPTLSRQIRDLEGELGVRLFDRVGRRIVLTAEGREMAARTRHVLAEADALRARGTVLGGGPGGVLRVGAAP
jgi:DNA-binding transcriptional LysR family regulator